MTEDENAKTNEGPAESVWKDLLNCQCADRYSIEAHGNGHALYFGRCNHRHGYNLLHITECTRHDILVLIEQRLNARFVNPKRRSA